VDIHLLTIGKIQVSTSINTGPHLAL